jgi:hypothetical protein
LIVLAAVAGLGLPVVARASEPITKREARAMPTAEFNARTMNQIADLFEPRADDRRRKPTRPLDYEVFHTVPRTTSIRGLCRVDQLAVTFAPAEGRGKGIDRPSRASGFTAQSFFAFVIEPPNDARFHSDLFGGEDTPSVPETGPCAGAAFAGGAFAGGAYFAAESERDAADAYLIFRGMIAEAQKADWIWRCDGANTDCAARVEGMVAGDADRVDRCDSYVLGAQCFRYLIGNRTVRIVSTLPASKLQDGVLKSLPVKILEVETQTVIVLTHEAVD